MSEPSKKNILSCFRELPKKALISGALIVVAVLVIVGVISAHLWDYTNSPAFCGTLCHTMPPEYESYNISLHANVSCVDCHIGEASTLEHILMKTTHAGHLPNLILGRYHTPITAKSLRPATASCEYCHWPQAFHDDAVREIKHFEADKNNTGSSIFMVMRTGGGAEREGRGKGIHWHIENDVWYIATDKQKQIIPWVKAVDSEGNSKVYIDETADITPEFIEKAEKRKMDCLDCHSRTAHLFRSPDRAMNRALSLRQISKSIPFIKKKGIEVLEPRYKSVDEGVKAIHGLEGFYQSNYAGFYKENQPLIKKAVQEIEKIFRQTTFPEMNVGWSTYADNTGHKEFPGCFRCHNGKHFNSKGESISLHCHLCHSIPMTVKEGEHIKTAELGKMVLATDEPESHSEPNFIANHRFQADQNCGACHGNVAFGYKNGSFCSNEACHGTKWPMVNLDARVNHPIQRIGKHAEVWCHKCHKGERKPEYVCSNCHNPPAPSHYGPDCSQCHSPVGWKESAAFATAGKKMMPIPHGLEGRENCLICHGEGKFKAFPDDHKGRSNNQCLGCHKKSEKMAQAVKAEDKTSPPSESTCVSCHTSVSKLIKLTKEIAASRPKVEKSAESEGEG
jgi:hypothetical protein